MVLAEPFAESLQSCSQCCLIGRWLVAIIVSARLGHLPGHIIQRMQRLKRRFQQDRGRSAAPEAARTILSGFGQVKNRRIQVKLLRSCGK